MKKTLTLILTLVLVLAMTLTGAQASPESLMGKTLKDFSVKTYDGKTFKLSESLKTHDLVVINFWATWCGPCCAEFPFLQEAWEQYSDRVDVIAMSIERTDSAKVLKAFAKEYGLQFPMGRDEKKMFNSMKGEFIPTTLIVNKDRQVVAVEVGMKDSVEAFTDLFDSLLEDIPADDAEPSVQL